MPHLHYAASGSAASLVLTLILILTVLVYLRGWLSLRSSMVNVSSAWRASSFLVGVFLVWIAVASPIAALDHELLTIHMLEHLLLMTLAPPLIWIGAPEVPLFRGLPQRFRESLLGPLFRSPPANRLRKALGQPGFCWIAACAALIGWHVPALFTLGIESTAWHLVEHTSFLATGLLFWWPVVQSSRDAFRQDLSIILYLFFATLPCDILSGLLVFSDRVVYPVYLSSSHRFGFSALGDQQCAAALMWTTVTAVYLVASAILTMRLLSPQGLSQNDLMRLKMRDGGIPPSLPPGLEF
jgi:putative membrane protein